jgi:hypothetical protein
MEKIAKGIGVIGARALPREYQPQVAAVVQRLIERGYDIFSGGALGADQFALEAIAGADAFRQSVIFSAWASVSGFPVSVRDSIHRYIAYGGMVEWGEIMPGAVRGLVVAGLLERNARLVRASAGLVAFLYGESSGTRHTIAEALRLGRRVIIFLCGGGAELPIVSSGHWVRLGGRSPFAGAYLFLSAISFDKAQDEPAQREPAIEGTRAGCVAVPIKVVA